MGFGSAVSKAIAPMAAPLLSPGPSSMIPALPMPGLAAGAAIGAALKQRKKATPAGKPAFGAPPATPAFPVGGLFGKLGGIMASQPGSPTRRML